MASRPCTVADSYQELMPTLRSRAPRRAVTAGLESPTAGGAASAASRAGQKPQAAVLPAKFDAGVTSRRVTRTLGTAEFQRR
jgi:hypothetical protein